MINTVYYLEDSDIDSNLKLKPYVNSRYPKSPIIVMIHSSYCGHCVNAKPAFETFSKDHNAAAIQTDDSDAVTMNTIKKWHPELRGVPCYLGFNSKGEFVKVYTGDRSINSLVEFYNELN